MEKASVNSSRRAWQPMRLHYVGRIGDLMQGGTFSRIESGNGGRDKGVGGG